IRFVSAREELSSFLFSSNRMGNTPSDSAFSSPGDIWDIWTKDDEEDARLLERAREAAGGNDTTGLSVTGADGVTGAVTGTGADATGVTGVTGETTTGAPVAKHNWAASNTKASGGKDATTGKDETTGTGNVGKVEETGGSGVCVAGTTVGGKGDTTTGADNCVAGLTAAGLKGGDATNKELALGDNGTAEPGTQAGTAPAPVSAAKGAAAPKPELSAEMREAMAMDPPFALDFCGLVPDPDGLYEDYIPDPRIKESRLTPEEKTKFLGLLDQIFHPDTVLGVRVWFDPNDVVEVVTKVIPYLESEPMLIEDLPFDITIVADLHGQLYDLDLVFKAEERDGKKGWENMKFLFLGDYVDRGRQSLEIVMALYCIKMLYPDQVFLLRGNHEFMHTNQKGGFMFDFYDRYVDEEWPAIYFKVNESFCYLSSAAIVGDSYFCAHGGISVQAFTRRHLLAIKKPIIDSKSDMLIHDVSWSDPALGLQGSTFNGQRMCSSYFGLDELSFALYNMNCTTLFRGHSIMNYGFELIGGLCVSLFTATGSRNFNDGAVAIIDANGHVSFRIIVCSPERVSLNHKLRRMDGAAEDLGDDTVTVEDDSGEGETVNMKKE
ncbi:hypothetical protein PRIPAC_93200, partial [Pristionchus pacificus]